MSWKTSIQLRQWSHLLFILCLMACGHLSLAQSAIVLTKATTVDAKSVTVEYTISQAPVTPSLKFDFYRSHQSVIDNGSTLIGTQTLTPRSVDQQGNPALSIGTHTVTFISGTSLPPIPVTTATHQSQQYVVVVANGDHLVNEDPASVNTTYFRKYLLGVVVHGFTFACDEASTLAWMNSMGKALTDDCSFDKIILFNWMSASREPSPGLACEFGDRLYSQLTPAAHSLTTHSGDVVDVHFIGHSRGTVVVSLALQDLAIQKNPALQGSYVEVTLLDIHPTNLLENSLLSYTGLTGYLQELAILIFDPAADDPEITLPVGANIGAVDIWYQQTPAASFPRSSSEETMNLWGEGNNTAMMGSHIKNLCGVSPTWHNLTKMSTPQTGMIGHSEVHEYYRLFEVNPGEVH